ncbi:MAG TPA: crotonase/enoyl-CoA hydratase family protein [Roseiarcus sp.]|nr:crotonase/enoyl-CoA hydratase family protein [Roseiarcus sp.]
MTAVSVAKSPPPVSIKIDGEIAIIRLDRPAKRNALNDESVLALETAFRGLPERVKAAVLHGAGEHFSAGLDLSELIEKNLSEAIDHARFWHRAFEAIEFGRIPVVSALNGAVVGGGLELAAATHVRVAEKSAFYALPEGQRGIFVGGGGSVRLSRLIGASRMMEMMLTGRVYRAEEGYQFGFSHYVVAEGHALAKAIELARKIVGNAGLTNFALIQALPRIADGDRASGYLIESLMSAIAQDDAEAKSRMRDFLEKRGAKVAPQD